MVPSGTPRLGDAMFVLPKLRPNNPKHPSAAAPGLRPYGFNKAHQVDLKYVKDHRGKKYVFLSMLDVGTVHHQAVMCKTRRSEYMCKWRLRLPFGGSRGCRQGRNLLVTPHIFVSSHSAFAGPHMEDF